MKSLSVSPPSVFSLFFLFFTLFTACKTDNGKCKFGDPVAIFSDTMQAVKKHHFEIKDKTGIEYIVLKNGLLLEIEQSGCNTINQQFTFELVGDFSKQDDAFWKTLAAKNFQMLSNASVKLQPFIAWSEAIESVKSKMKLGEAVYKAQQTSGEAAADAQAQADATGAPNANADGDVVDAQFEDVSDDKKNN